MAPVNPLVNIIRQTAIQNGIDPAAALSVASMEGLSGRVGDNGTSFGPFQLHVGGALPKGIANPQAWASSPAGIKYAISRMGGAKGLKGQAAINAIVRQFERPANPDAEVSGAVGKYGQFRGAPRIPGAPVPGVTPGRPGTPGTPGIPGTPATTSTNPALGSLLKVLGLGGISQIATTHIPGVPGIPGSPGTAPKAPTVKVQGNVTPNDIAAVKLAQKFIGTPYQWGGSKPGGFDCSGLLQYIWGQRGVNIPRTTYEQFTAGQPVGKNMLRPGDAVFFTGSDPKNGLPGHVAIYIGNGKIIQAPHTGATVEITKLSTMAGYQGARRYG